MITFAMWHRLNMPTDERRPTRGPSAPQPNALQCAQCGGEFSSERGEDEAREELARNFPGRSVEQCAVVCSDCYAEILSRIDHPAARGRS
jgi:hypothetical protein